MSILALGARSSTFTASKAREVLAQSSAPTRRWSPYASSCRPTVTATGDLLPPNRNVRLPNVKPVPERADIAHSFADGRCARVLALESELEPVGWLDSDIDARSDKRVAIVAAVAVAQGLPVLVADTELAPQRQPVRLPGRIGCFRRAGVSLGGFVGQGRDRRDQADVDCPLRQRGERSSTPRLCASFATDPAGVSAGAGGGGRTLMPDKGRWILSPVRLPIPPLQHLAKSPETRHSPRPHHDSESVTVQTGTSKDAQRFRSSYGT